jgi:hypothetical protein
VALVAVGMMLAGCNAARRSQGVMEATSITPPPSFSDPNPPPAKAAARSRSGTQGRAAASAEPGAGEDAGEADRARPMLTPGGRPGAGFRF